MAVELTVLGSSGSYGGPTGGACSGYLLRAGNTAIWLDCGNGTFVNLQRHMAVEDLSAVVISHRHPDHCVDLFGLHVMYRYGLGRVGLPVYGPERLSKELHALADFADTFVIHEMADGDEVTVGDIRLRFAQTDHPPPTLAVEATSGGKRLIYTADTGPGWSPTVFGAAPDVLLSEATYQRGSIPNDSGATMHLTAEQAGLAARACGARRLVITHVWPTLDPNESVAEASAAFGEPVTLAAPGVQLRV